MWILLSLLHLNSQIWVLSQLIRCRSHSFPRFKDPEQKIIGAYLTVDIFIANGAYEVAAVILISEFAERPVEQNGVKKTETNKRKTLGNVRS